MAGIANDPNQISSAPVVLRLHINSSTSFKPWADNIQNVEVGPPSMVSASEYAKRKGDNCQPKAFTYRLTTESLPNETTETVGPILPDLIDLRYHKKMDEFCTDLCGSFQASVLNNLVPNPMLQKLLSAHLGQGNVQISSRDLGLGCRSLGEVFKLFARQQRLVVKANV